MALVALSVVEQRLDAVRAVLAGADVVEVAAQVGVSRQSVHAWLSRYLSEGVAGLADRSSRPRSCPHRSPERVQRAVLELRREHPRWGAKRIRMELLRGPVPWADPADVAADAGSGAGVPSVSTINRILARHGLVKSRPRKRPRSSFKRFERPGPMQLWGIDIVGGIQLVDTTTGVLREAKIVTGVDDHSRFCVMATVVERATSRAVCLAFAQALARFGVPEEVITDNGKQFTDRFSRYGPTRGEVLFDKICRKNGITHRLTAPASPNQNGKVERFHGTFRPEIGEQGPFTSLEAAQAAVDVWVAHYNSERPHQGLDDKVPVVPADRFIPAPVPESEVVRDAVQLWTPPALEITNTPAFDQAGDLPAAPAIEVALEQAGVAGSAAAPGDAVELDKVVPASGNMSLCGSQFWLGVSRAGQTVRFWIDCEWVHLSIAGVRVKSLRSRFTVNDLARLRAQGAVLAGPAPMASRGGPGSRSSRTVFEVERTVARNGTVSLGNKTVLAAEILAGRRVGIYVEEGAPLLFFDLETRELLRTRPNPLQPGDAARLQQSRPVGPVPRPSTEPVTVQRRVASNGVFMVAGQKVALGRAHAGRTVTVHVSETTLAIEVDAENGDLDTRVVRRTTEHAVRSIKGQRPRTADTSVS